MTMSPGCGVADPRALPSGDAQDSLDRVPAIEGAARVGSIVRVVDRAGRESAYELVDRLEAAAPPQRVPLAAPEGRALLGARAGDHIPMTLGNGRRRRVRVLDVQP